MKARLFLSSTAVLAAALLAVPLQGTGKPIQNYAELVEAGASTPIDSIALVPDLTIAPAVEQIAFAGHTSHSSHSSHSSHASHSSHTSSSFV